MATTTSGHPSGSFSGAFLSESAAILAALDTEDIERVATGLAAVRDAGGRLFVVGVGGSAANASHAVNDFRKICGFEAYTPTDNVSELTARINDEGWDGVLATWLVGSRLSERDAVLVFSVGGGDRERGVSVNLANAIDLALLVGARVYGVVGRDGGETRRRADVAVVIPPLFAERVTPHTEAVCAVVWHLLVSHPVLRRAPTMWESVAGGGRA